MRAQEAQEQADADRALAEAADDFAAKQAAQAVRDRAEVLRHGATLRALEDHRRQVAEQRAGRIAELRAELARLDPGQFGTDAPDAARFAMALADGSGEVTVTAASAAAMMPDDSVALLARSRAEAAAWSSGPMLSIRRAAVQAEHNRPRLPRPPRRAAAPRPREVTRTAPPLARPEFAAVLPQGDY